MVKARLTTPDGVTIEFESSTDEYASALAATLRAIRRADAPLYADETPGPTRAQLEEFAGRVSSETAEYLRLLASHPKGLSDNEIESLLELDSRQRLAGMNGAVTKVAGSVGIEDDLIASTVTRTQDGGRSYHYEVPAHLRAGLMEVLGVWKPPQATLEVVNDDLAPF